METTKLFKIPSQFGRELVDALRSGEFKQTTDTLYDGVCYCVIGLAGHIAGVEDDDLLGHSNIFDIDIYERHTLKLPEDLCYQMYKWNDSELLTFPEIANRIEEICDFV